MRIKTLVASAYAAYLARRRAEFDINMRRIKARYPILQRVVPIHPTVSELIPTVLGDLKPAG
jgi:hypothetical protein